MTTREERIAGLRTVVVEAAATPRLIVVVLHGYAMEPEDLVPFARSMGVPATFYFPQAPRRAQPEGHAWWEIDVERREQAIAAGARDLYEEAPAGASEARTQLVATLAHVRLRAPHLPLAIVGFSQGGMLACDTVLRERPSVAGLALLSSSRIAVTEWTPLAGRLNGLPILLSHGTRDTDLAFVAGEALRDFCARGGAQVTWVPFEGAHEIPLVVWRRVRTFLLALSVSPSEPAAP